MDCLQGSDLEDNSEVIRCAKYYYLPPVGYGKAEAYWAEIAQAASCTVAQLELHRLLLAWIQDAGAYLERPTEHTPVPCALTIGGKKYQIHAIFVVKCSPR